MHLACMPTPHADWDFKSTYEPGGSGPITTGSISECASFLRTFVFKSKCFIGGIDNGYDITWDTTPPVVKEMRN